MKKKDPKIRERLIEIATEKFLKAGYARTSMAQISAAFGGSKTTLYTHFPAKEEIFLAVVDRLARGRVDNAFSALTLQGPIRETLVDFGEKYLAVTCSEEILKVFRMGISEGGQSEAGSLIYNFGPRLCRKKIADYFMEFSRNNDGYFKDFDPNIASIHYLRLIEADLVELFLLGIRDAPSQEEIQVSVKAGVDVFLDAYLVVKSTTHVNIGGTK